MKPDWNKAPEWANWLMMDEDGTWWWTECQPPAVGEHDTGWATGGGDYDMAEATVEPSWRDSLERRP